MSPRFMAMPRDPETRIISERCYMVYGLEFVRQVWEWDHVRAESLIFITQDITNLCEQRLRTLLDSIGLLPLDTPITYAQSRSGYTFISHSFKDTSHK